MERIKKMKKYNRFFAFFFAGCLVVFLCGQISFLNMVETTKPDKDMDTFNHPEFQKSYKKKHVIKQIFLHPKTKSDLINKLLLEFALKCSLLPKHSPLKIKERTDFFDDDNIYYFKGSFNFSKNKELLEQLLNQLENLDTKDIIDHILPEDRFMAYELATECIPLALHRRKTEEARYFYEKIIQHVPKDAMRRIAVKYRYNTHDENLSAKDINQLDEHKDWEERKGANILNAQLIKNAVQYYNAETIIQDLLGAPYQITPDDMDGAFWLGFKSCAPDHFYVHFNENEICRLFLNPKIRPSLKMVEKILKTHGALWQKKLSLLNRFESYDHGKDLIMNFLGLFFAIYTPEEQNTFDFNRAFKKLGANVLNFPELGKIFDRMHKDYMMAKMSKNR